jgi:Ni,Fe-hydrogenase III large subunit
LVRGLCLELERVANHIGDCGALAHDVAAELAASELAALREQLLRLNAEAFGHRLLRGLNRPGGIVLPQSLQLGAIRARVGEITAQFIRLGRTLAGQPAFRSRLQWTGILTRQQALDLGVTGLVARASGVPRDYRLQHPTGIYTTEAIRSLLEQGLRSDGSPIAGREVTAGDALARFLARIREVELATTIIDHILALPELNTPESCWLSPAEFRPKRNFELGLGYADGWRGDVVYWLMQDKFERIYRCMVRDPSLLNWPALKAAVDCRNLEEEYVKYYRPPKSYAETILADFPIINKSFNLSYAGHDL